MTRGSRAESKNCEILLLPTADRRFDTTVKCPTGRASFWVKFPTVWSLTRVKCPGIARGGMGGFGIDWYITSQANMSITQLYSTTESPVNRGPEKNWQRVKSPRGEATNEELFS